MCVLVLYFIIPAIIYSFKMSSEQKQVTLCSRLTLVHLYIKVSSKDPNECHLIIFNKKMTFELVQSPPTLTCSSRMYPGVSLGTLKNISGAVREGPPVESVKKKKGPKGQLSVCSLLPGLPGRDSRRQAGQSGLALRPVLRLSGAGRASPALIETPPCPCAAGYLLAGVPNGITGAGTRGPISPSQQEGA